jgi:hypothetical protein
MAKRHEARLHKMSFMDKAKMLVSMGTIVCAGITWGVISTERDSENIAKFGRDQKELTGSFAADGLTFVPDRSPGAYNRGVSEVTISLGGCSLSGITYDKKKDKGTGVVDTSNYTFDGLAYPRPYTEEERVSLHYDTVTKVTGAETHFVFQDLDGLEEQFGPKPCVTLTHLISNSAVEEIEQR